MEKAIVKLGNGTATHMVRYDEIVNGILCKRFASGDLRVAETLCGTVAGSGINVNRRVAEVDADFVSCKRCLKHMA